MALKGDFLLLTFPKRSCVACHPGPQAEAPESVGRQKRARGRPRLSLYWGFHGVAHARQIRFGWAE